MSKALFAALAVTTYLVPAAVLAATVDQAGADQLRGTLERYVGVAPQGQAPHVTVAPDGAAYKVTIDLDSLVKKTLTADIPNVKVSVPATSFHATPLDNGTWHIADFSPLKGTFSLSDQSGSFEAPGLSFDGIYDPALAAFSSAQVSFPVLNIDQQSPEATSSASLKDTTETVTGTAGPAGTTNFSVNAKSASYKDTISLNPKDGTATGANGSNITIDISAGKHDLTISGTGIRMKPMLDLWAMLVAYDTKAERDAHEAEAKAKVLEALPFLDTMTYDVAISDVAIKTPFGQGGFGSGTAHFDLSTAHPSNSFAMAFKVNDLSVDTVFLPEPAKPLVPTRLDFGASVKDFDLDAGLRKAIELDDPTKVKDPALKAANDQKIAEAFVPKGVVTVQLPPSGVGSSVYSIGWQGAINVTTTTPKPMTTAHLDVKASGIDAVARAIGQIKAPYAAEAMIGIYAAQAVGKKEADGSISWALDYSDAAGLLVNGKRIGK